MTEENHIKKCRLALNKIKNNDYSYIEKFRFASFCGVDFVEITLNYSLSRILLLTYEQATGFKFNHIEIKDNKLVLRLEYYNR